MKPLSHFRRFSTLLLLPLALGLSQCGKKEDPAAPKTGDGSAPGTSGKAAEVSKAPSLVDHAAKLGFAAKLPLDTELYVGSTQLKKHLGNIKKSAWWKELDALIEDKTPAPSAGEKVQQLFMEAWGDDMFFAGTAGFAKDAVILKEFNRLYNEWNFKMLMAGGMASLDSEDGSGFNPMKLIPMLADEAGMEKAADFFAKFQLPPMLAGVKTEKAQELVAEIFSEKNLKNKPEEIEITDLKTPEGYALKVVTVRMDKLMTETKRKEITDGAAKILSEDAMKAFTKALDDLSKKKFVFGMGAIEGHLLVACGQNLDHVKFVSDPAKSLLAKGDLGWLLPYAEKDVTGVIYATAATQSALHDDQPLVPMLRGAVAAMRENEMFKPMAAMLDKQVTEMSTLETAVYAHEFTSAAGISWWENGALYLETFGGARTRFATLGKPLTFAGLVDRPGVVFGIAYHRNPEYEKAVRLWIEKIVSIGYTAAQQLVQAGIAGPDGGQQFALFEMMLLPTIKEVYQADRRINEQGLGSQFAYFLDVNGKMPSLPNVPLEDAQKMKFPRLTMVAEVANRGEVAAGWETINKTITNLATIAGSMMGKGADGNAAPPAVPAPESTSANGVTTWYYKNDIFNGDLFPVAAISDKLLVLSTSKAAAESFTAELAQPPAKAVDGCVWRLDLSALADFASDGVALSPTQTPEQIKEARQNLKWIQPLRALQGHIYQEKGQPRFSMKWQLSDIVSFD